MRNQTFVFTFLTAVMLASSLQAAFCPEIICGKPNNFGAVRKLYGYREITTKQLRKLLESEQPILVFDARAEEHDDGRRLPNAQHLPYNTPDTEIETIVNPKDALIVVYCTNAKCLHSRYLAESMVRLGYTRVFKYPAGLEGWANAKQPIASVER